VLSIPYKLGYGIAGGVYWGSHGLIKIRIIMGIVLLTLGHVCYG